MKIFGPQETPSLVGYDQPPRGEALDLLRKQKETKRRTLSSTVFLQAEETKPKSKLMVDEALNGIEIDPLRVIVWAAFLIILVSSWAAIFRAFGLI